MTKEPRIIAFDIETKEEFPEKDENGRYKGNGYTPPIEKWTLLYGCYYDSLDDQYHPFTQKTVSRSCKENLKDKPIYEKIADKKTLEEVFEEADIVVAHNGLQFDNVVLQQYMPDLKLNDLPYWDILKELQSKKGRIGDMKLEGLGDINFGLQKKGTFRDAKRLWYEGKHEEAMEYCKRDVEITKRVFDKGIDESHVLFFNKKEEEIQQIDTPDWKREVERIVTGVPIVSGDWVIYDEGIYCKGDHKYVTLGAGIKVRDLNLQNIKMDLNDIVFEDDARGTIANFDVFTQDCLLLCRVKTIERGGHWGPNLIVDKACFLTEELKDIKDTDTLKSLYNNFSMNKSVYDKYKVDDILNCISEATGSEFEKRVEVKRN